MQGAVATPCPAPACARHLLHRIPLEYLPGGLDPGARTKTDRRRGAIGQRLGDFLLVDLLGSGGFGEVYLALQVPILLKAALKLMKTGPADPDRRASLAAKFESEAQALASLNHPNIVRLLKYGQDAGDVYIAMEYVPDARTLGDELKRCRRAAEAPPEATVFHVLHQVLAALEAAHEHRIIHRDIKPDNVMLQTVGQDSHFVRVVDFGLAKFLGEGEDTSVLIGTPMYLAPEQVRLRNIGPWTDVYAVGVLAFELLTLRKPFPGSTPQEILRHKLDPGFDPLDSAADLRLSDSLAAWLRKALAIDPEDRYRSAAGMGAALEGAERSLRPSAGPIEPKPPERPKRPPVGPRIRRTGWLAALALVAWAAVALLSRASWQDRGIHRGVQLSVRVDPLGARGATLLWRARNTNPHPVDLRINFEARGQPLPPNRSARIRGSVQSVLEPSQGREMRSERIPLKEVSSVSLLSVDLWVRGRRAPGGP